MRRLLCLAVAPRPSHVADASPWLTGFSRAEGGSDDRHALGRLRRKLDNRIVLECGRSATRSTSADRHARVESADAETGDKASELALVIYYHATRDQPRPVLIGFTSDLDKEFFEKLITVKDIGR